MSKQFYDEIVEKLTNPMKQKPYKVSSVKPVFSYLTKLNGGNAPSSLDFLLDRPIVLPFLQTYAIGTQRSIIFAIRNIAKDFNRQDILDIWNENIIETEAGKGLPEPQTKSEKQQIAYAKVETDKGGDAWDMISKKVEENTKKIEENKKLNELIYVVPNLYTMFPPRRNIDYTEMKITTNYDPSFSKKFNYLVIGVENGKTEMRYIFNRYKTDGVYRQQIFDVPDDLIEILKKWIKAMDKKDDDYLLTTRFGSQLGSEDITDVLNRVFGKGISSSMLRHMYLDKYNNAEREDIIREMMGDAEKMAHSISTQQNTYVKK
jgi:hypothetical protein